MNYLIGIILLSVGSLCAIYRKKAGIAFCLYGKKNWENSPFGLSKAIESTYDENRAPWFFLFFGIVLIAMGVLFLFANG